MSNEFEQISIKPGFMKHNGGVLFRTISDKEYEFKSTINENHLNAANITHGGYLSALKPFKDPLYVPIGVLNAAVITTSFDFLLIDSTA